MGVAGLGAWCDLLTEEEYRQRLVRDAAAAPPPVAGDEPRPGLIGWSPVAVDEAIADFRRSAHFDVHEFAVLDDGRRITLHEERGFGVSGPADPWADLTLEWLTGDVLNTVLPDDDDGEAHPWEWLAELLRVRGVTVSAADLRQVPYVVEFSERLRARLAAPA